jgi:hypothetical protein
MNCQWVQENLSAFIDNELPLTQKAMIDSHLSQCSHCKAEFDNLTMAWDSLTLWEDKHPPLHLKESILRAVKKGKTFNFMRILLPVAAVFVIALSIVFFYRELGNYDQRAHVIDKKGIQQPVAVESVMVDDEEIIKNLQFLEEKDFYETVEVLETIDYLPLIEERMDQKSSMGYYAT